jgi:hypothetical protein
VDSQSSQWEETLKPDYVLIDSRTGHSEIGGICTRQLPHTVVVLFIPVMPGDVVGRIPDILAHHATSRSDLDEIERLIDGHSVLPKFMR